jgi:hypothetical protein
MKILTEKDQKYNRMGEISRLRTVMLSEIEELTKVVRREVNPPLYRVTDHEKLNKLNNRIDQLYKVIDALTDYRDMIGDSIND